MSAFRSLPVLLCFCVHHTTAVALPVRQPPATLPAFLPARAAEIREPAAVEALRPMKMAAVSVDTPALRAVVRTCYYDTPARGPTPRERFDGLEVRLSERMRTSPLVLQRRGTASTLAPTPLPILCLHGADASSLERRRLLPRLARLGLSGVSLISIHAPSLFCIGSVD